jgi:hypothetical protein
VNSGAFLEYDHKIDNFVVGPIQKALLDLRDYCAFLRAGDPNHWWKVGEEFCTQYQHRKDENAISIPNSKMIHILGLADREENILRLSFAILNALQGNPSKLKSLRLRPMSPLPEGEPNKPALRPTFAEASEWLNTKMN